MLEIICGFVLGILASAIVWLFGIKVLVPKIYFVPKISRMKDSDRPNGCSYRVKIHNTGRRDIIDISAVCELYTRGLQTSRRGNVISFYIPIDESGRPRLKKGANVIFQLYPDDIAEALSSADFDEQMTEKCKDGKPTLEDLLGFSYEGKETTLIIHMFGYDGFSGTRKHFASSPYKLGDVVKGPFSKGPYKSEGVSPENGPSADENKKALSEEGDGTRE